ncbi:MAG: PD-(D/E)XK nuclease family protein [Planctomycetes bacterium]|nr:PD-(D/E)XK nuclease family protein [Planctomycetota bacterium]
MIDGLEKDGSLCAMRRVVELAHRRLNGGFQNPNLFILRPGEACPASAALGWQLCEWLGREFRILALDLTLPRDQAGTAAEYFCVAIDSSQPETVRDVLKERLWPATPKTLPRATLDDVLHGRHDKTAPDFRLEEYGLFIPCRTRRHTAIRTHSFAHRPAYYRYRLALARTAGLLEPMADYLHSLFTNCPNHLFRATVFRASGVSRGRLGVEIPLTRAIDHGIITLASRSHGFREVSSRHENLQKYFLEHDSTTIACEVPVWMESWEFADYLRILKTREPLTGHIDVLRHESDGLLGVWDYKPHAAAERNAHVQVFLYALMLSLRTGLPLSAFHCGYFDEKDAYLFRPAQARLARE